MQTQNDQNKLNSLRIIAFVCFFLFFINPPIGIIAIIFLYGYIKKNKITLNLDLVKSIQNINSKLTDLAKNNINSISTNISKVSEPITSINIPNIISTFSGKKTRLEKKKRYLHIALNSTIEDAREIISQLPFSDRILIEVGTPLVKIYGTDAISRIKSMTPYGTYIVADNKCADLAYREVEMMANAGANAATCLGVSPIETIDSFIEECEKFNIDSIIDMMNVESPISILKRLKKLPSVVMLHRGVDESEFSKEKQIPYYQIKQIKGSYNILVAVAGGDTIKEVQSAIFNDADIVVVWKDFYESNANTSQLADSFLKSIK